MKDREILDRIVKGDERALDYLYKKYYRMMTNIVLKNNGTEEEAKDVYQEALLAFWQKAASGKLVLTSKISTFLYSICLNQWRKELDRKSRLSREEVEKEDYQGYDEKERYKIVIDCIGELGDTCRRILTYYYFDGLNMSDIAEKLNFANTDTAKTKKYKCKKKLDSLIKERYSTTDFFD
ncbi:RNA polymerase sigma factor [Marinoscillum furvescens]|uniref:RNA polymerase sigma factor (Sigma-70 family) n=1 Tax=Marinoscillum furvescens DSM 4134 TaxID=1122208 RepID=A0A3D9L5J0_MARFU|nr:sigma-70 family RNA polymerase sigma factor [Marinoscillum furvescens]REE01273.1 RNA polymerase sigma factor (sigma-70 family) [Marinoscillum furvescens DSM 4134]